MTRRDAPKAEAVRCGILTCACRKRAYLSRQDARNALRRLYPNRDGDADVSVSGGSQLLPLRASAAGGPVTSVA